MSEQQQAALTVVFKDHPILNEAKSKAAGRPIYDSREVCEIRAAGDRHSIKVFPATETSHWEEDENGMRHPVTYAMRFNAQYLRFKEGKTQVQSGTPLEELPFLTQAKRLELKALHIHTAEALACLDGTPLKQLGINGRELKNQAQAYIDNARGSADVTKLAAEVESLKQQLAAERDARMATPHQTPAPAPVSAFDAMGDDELKAFIAEKTGSRPRGQPAHATLVRMAEELAQSEAA